MHEVSGEVGPMFPEPGVDWSPARIDRVYLKVKYTIEKWYHLGSRKMHIVTYKRETLILIVSAMAYLGGVRIHVPPLTPI